jgi:hypothetical protein
MNSPDAHDLQHDLQITSRNLQITTDQVLLLKRDLVAVVRALRGLCALTGDECFKENAEAWERADRALREYEHGRES